MAASLVAFVMVEHDPGVALGFASLAELEHVVVASSGLSNPIGERIQAILRSISVQPSPSPPVSSGGPD